MTKNVDIVISHFTALKIIIIMIMMIVMIMIKILVSQYPTALHSPPLVQGDALHGCFEHLTINSLELLTCHWCTMVHNGAQV